MRILVLFVFYFGLILELSAQDTTRYEIDSIDLLSFKEEARYKYLLFFESTLNLIDTKLDIDDRYRSRSVLLELFTNSQSTISDILNSPNPTSYDPYTYGYELLKGAQEQPLLYKRFKYSDDFEFDLRPYKGLNVDSDRKSYNIYEGEMFVLEKLINSKNIPQTFLNKPTFNAYEEGLVKKIKFRIGHNSQKEYELKISAIDILQPNNKAYDYKSIVKNIEKSSYKWSDQSEEEYLASIRDEAIELGILPNIAIIEQKKDSIIQKEINIVFKEDTLTYKKPNFVDYSLPGYGHIRYGLNSKTRFIKTVIYGSIFISSTTFSIYNKIKSENQYSLHKSAETFRNSNSHYDLANEFHKRFVISTGISILSLVANAVHLNISHKNQKNKIEKARKNKLETSFNKNKISVIIPEVKFGTELSFVWKF